MQKEEWGSRIGLILAAAGNAIGIGNLLRFPSKAASNGGGAFMIPYFLALVFLGIPMVWVMWTIGRYGGISGHTTTPGMLYKIKPHPISKILGAIGVAIPLVFTVYYTYISSWCLAYSFFSFFKTYFKGESLDIFLQEYTRQISTTNYFSGYFWPTFFFLIVFFLNIYILSRGISKGIEKLCLYGMPLLVVMCIIMVVRNILLESSGKGTFLEGLGFVWNPDFTRLNDINVWIAATGQIFFSLSIGIGALECYASYVKKDDDIALTGLTTTATNEFVEVIFGSAIVIPATAIFFGVALAPTYAKTGVFNLGFITMPEIMRNTPLGNLFGGLWFFLLFLAAFTSSVAIAQPIMAFLQGVCGYTRGKAAFILGGVWVIATIPCIWWNKYGYIDELDSWAGELLLILFSFIELIYFIGFLGINKGWEELHRGAQMKVPSIFKFILIFISPIYLILLLGIWAKDTLPTKFHIKPYVNITPLYSTPNSGKSVGKVKYNLKEEAKEKFSKVVDSHKRDIKCQYSIDKEKNEPVLNTGASTIECQIIKITKDDIKIEELSAKGDIAPVDFVIEGLYRTPYIWLGRFFVLLTFIIFAYLAVEKVKEEQV
jgi:neurotransmitter:Na+ symporter, NSS family